MTALIRFRYPAAIAAILFGINLTSAEQGSSVPLVKSLTVAGRTIDPLAAPLGLKTYRDLGLTIEETVLAREVPAKGGSALSGQPKIFPLFAENMRLMVGRGGQVEGQRFENPNVVWTSYSKDGGQSWSEPRFLAALVEDGVSIHGLNIRKGRGEELTLELTNSRGRQFDLNFRQYDLRRLATADDLAKAPAGKFAIMSAPVNQDHSDLLASAVTVGNDIQIAPAHPPKGYEVRQDLGLIVQDSMEGEVVHKAQSAQKSLFETRAVVTPKGDYLVLIPDGSHANSKRKNANVMLAYRSSDEGKTWVGPTKPFGEGKHFGVLPIVPKGGGRIYVFESLREMMEKGKERDRTFGARYSDDDGVTWSQFEPVREKSGKLFGGVGVIPMSQSETEAGTLLAGFHHAKFIRGEKQSNGSRQWTQPALPENTDLTTAAGIFYMDELQAIALAGPNVLAIARTCEGHLWELRSGDDGKTWGGNKATPLVHPDAPPMVYRLSDGRTLIALHHNRAVMRSVYEPIHSQWDTMPTPTTEEVERGKKFPSSVSDWVSRAEVWFSLSENGGKTWSEPHFMLANALAESLEDSNPNYQCSYIDLFTDRGYVNLIIPHRWQRVVHLRFPESKLGEFLTRSELAKANAR